jgi:hypothetical protein
MSNPNSPEDINYTVEDVIQRLRTLRLDQATRQLRDDEQNNLDRFYAVAHFVYKAKELI